MATSKIRHAENMDNIMLQFAKNIPELIKKNTFTKLEHHPTIGFIGRIILDMCKNLHEPMYYFKA